MNGAFKTLKPLVLNHVQAVGLRRLSLPSQINFMMGCLEFRWFFLGAGGGGREVPQGAGSEWGEVTHGE